MDDAAGGQASELLGLVDELAADWGPRPPRVLRAGGLSVRDFKRLASVLDVDQAHAAFVVETAYVAGLLGDDLTNLVNSTGLPIIVLGTDLGIDLFELAERQSERRIYIDPDGIRLVTPGPER